MTSPKPLTIPDLVARKRSGEKIVMLTAYDAPLARLIDGAGIDAILVGDSLGMVILGQPNTLGVTMDAMVHHTQAVRRGADRAIVVADLPFLTYATKNDALRNAGRLLQEGGAHAVKLEGGQDVAAIVRKLVKAGIPVMGHIGLTPQSVNALGGFRKVGGNAAERQRVLKDAKALERAGAFSLVLEMMPTDLAKLVTESVSIPTIGISAGPHCDGQILVGYDPLGLYDEFLPSFSRQYVKLADVIRKGAASFIKDVRSGKFPEEPKPV